MKKKYQHLIIALLVLSGAISSCKKSFLDETNYSRLSVTQYASTKSGFEGLVISAYSGLRSIYNSKSYQSVTELGTDIVTQNFSGAVNPLNQYTVNFDSNNSDIYGYWSALYVALKNINAVLDRAPNVMLNTASPEGIDPAVLAMRVGEAKALRAMILFEIIRNWGKAPLILKETVEPTREATLSDGAAFYTQIIKDLTEAIAVLPQKQSGANYGRFSAAAAKHLRALVYLTRGYQNYGSNDDFNSAYNDAVDVINTSGHALQADFAAVHRQTNETNNEIIFSVGFSTSANNNTNAWPTWYLFPYREGYTGLSKSAIYGNDNVAGIPTKLAYLLFDWQKDRRAEVTFMSPLNGNTATSIDGKSTGKNWFQATIAASVVINGKTIPIPVGDTALYFPTPTDNQYRIWSDGQKSNVRYKVFNYPTGDPADFSQDDYYKSAYQTTNSTTRTWLPVWKFKDANTVYNENNSASGTRDIYIYRLAETYLIAAEAAVKKGDNANALTYLNRIRARAEKVAGALQKNETVTLDDILDERAKELFGEVPRWNDLQRTGKLSERVLKYNWDVTHITGGVQTLMTPGNAKFNLRPLPIQWINLLTNKEGVQQNPGW
ncbi:RagB/SusD family nutrient uptake outer membrane protein [Mucilaginibacter terrae]|uniref:RagB/SusD family nutrient uptake outer membrane protein n=1 Tax=Mucilaginibacter terrae TaxID=1955052 RepID=A0ABU3GN31_9SPHI|nr:RagB/SusD family nutrient uptake outer membrane protein [Mucilaginibacter terrae]MDT3401189.1 hypothetical protein [Mucilaginibacter terrae]